MMTAASAPTPSKSRSTTSHRSLVAADDQIVIEGTELDLSAIGLAPPLGLFVDPGILDTHTATVDWGDGSGVQSATIFPGSGAGALGGKHTYADNGVYTVTVTVTDDDGGIGTDTIEVTVNNVNPTLVPAGPQTVDEGSQLSITNLGTITDPGFRNQPLGTDETFTYAINWGDGTNPDTGAATIDDVGGVLDLTDASFDGSHTYADNGTYTVTVRVADDDMSGNFTSGVLGIDYVQQTFTVTVNNVNPTLVPAGPQTVDEGSQLSITNLGTITDPGFRNQPLGTDETFTYAINWGDGTNPDTGAATIDDVGGVLDLTDASFDGSHTYADNGTYTVTVRVADDDMSGNFTSGVLGIDYVQQTFTVTVNNVNPTLVPAGPQTVDEGSQLSITNLGTITDPGFRNPTAGHRRDLHLRDQLGRRHQPRHRRRHHRRRRRRPGFDRRLLRRQPHLRRQRHLHRDGSCRRRRHVRQLHLGRPRH